MAVSKRKKKSSGLIGGNLLRRKRGVNMYVLAGIIVMLGAVGIYLKFFSHAGGVPNGYILYSSAPSSKTQYVINADKTGNRLFYDGQDNSPGQTTWSRKGDKLVEAAGRGITVINDLGTHQQVLTASPTLVQCGAYRQGSPYQYAPTFSPDGSMVAYIEESYTASTTGSCPVTATLVKVNTDGSGRAVVPITSGQSPIGWNLHWSNDGSKLFFASFNSSKGISWYTLPINGGAAAATKLPTGSGLGAIAFSYDESKIAYVDTKGASECYIYTANLDGSNPKAVYSSTKNDCISVSWSPDGASLAFDMSTTGPTGTFSIYTTSSSTASTTPTLITVGSNPVWQPMTVAATYSWFGGTATATFGTYGDIPVPGDYNGDKKVDRAMWRPSNATWYVVGVGNTQWGQAGDIPVPADYNGDGKIDYAVYRPSTGYLYIKGYKNLWVYPGGFPADVNGDRKADWVTPIDFNGAVKWDFEDIATSTDTYHNYSAAQRTWGYATDIPVFADYNGDGKADVAVYRPSTHTFYIYGIGTYQWGQIGDIPLAADFSGDGKADTTIFRPSTGQWFVRGGATTVYGQAGDIPVPADYLGNGRAGLAVVRP